MAINALGKANITTNIYNGLKTKTTTVTIDNKTKTIAVDLNDEILKFETIIFPETDTKIISDEVYNEIINNSKNHIYYNNQYYILMNKNDQEVTYVSVDSNQIQSIIIDLNTKTYEYKSVKTTIDYDARIKEIEELAANVSKNAQEAIDLANNATSRVNEALTTLNTLKNDIHLDTQAQVMQVTKSLNDLDTKLTEVVENVESNQNNILNLDTKINNEISKVMETITDKESTLQDQLNNVNDKIDINITNITKLKTDLDTFKDSQLTVNTDVESQLKQLAEDLAQAEEKINDGINVDLEELQNRLDTSDLDIAAIKNELATEIKDKLSTIDTKLEEHKNSIASNLTNINKNTLAIAEQSAVLNNLKSQIGTLQGTKVTELETKITEVETNLSNLTEKVTQDITNLNDAISSINSYIDSSIDDSLEGINTDIAQLKDVDTNLLSEITDIKAHILTLESNSNENTGKILSLDTRVQTIETVAIPNLTSELKNLQNTLEDLELAVPENLIEDLKNVTALVESLNTAVSNLLETDIVDIKADIITNSETISNLESDIADITSDVAELKALIDDNLNENLELIDTKLTELETEINNIIDTEIVNLKTIVDNNTSRIEYLETVNIPKISEDITTINNKINILTPIAEIKNDVDVEINVKDNYQVTCVNDNINSITLNFDTLFTQGNICNVVIYVKDTNPQIKIMSNTTYPIRLMQFDEVINKILLSQRSINDLMITNDGKYIEVFAYERINTYGI